MDATAAYNVYAEQLFPFKHGYPLWHPEPTKHGEVEIGDVGYFREGGFYRLFNTTRPREMQQHFGVPDHYTPFVVNQYLLNESKDVIKTQLTSRSVKTVDASGNVSVSAGSIEAIGGGLKFTCQRERGAFLFVRPAADSYQMHQSRSFSRYMMTQIDEWYHFATDRLDLDLAREDIIFVSGTVKTEDWGLGAFTHQGSGGEISFQANVGPFAQGSFNFNRAHMVTSGAEWRTKPLDRPSSVLSSPVVGLIAAPESEESSSSSLASASSLSLQRTQSGGRKDQSVFLHYYKLKTRWWRNKVIRAAAGPNDPGHASEDEDLEEGTSLDMSSGGAGVEQAYDPVGFILDYILDYMLEDGTQADAAIASTGHLYDLFADDVPDDIPAALQKLQPPIVFVHDRVAALACAEWAEELDDQAEVVQSARAFQKQKATEVDPSFDEGDTNAGDGDNDEPSKADGSRQYAGADAGTALLMDHAGSVPCIAWSPDGRYIASGSEDTTVILRDGVTGGIVHKLEEHTDAVWALAFSPDSKYLVTGASDRRALIWEIASFSIVAELEDCNSVVQTIQYSHDGKRLVTSSVASTDPPSVATPADFSVRLWDAKSGALLNTMEGHTAVVMNAVFSPDDRRIASCSADYTAKIWDAQTGTLYRTLEGHRGLVWSIAFDPESRRVVTGSEDMTSRVWSAETGEALVNMYEHTGGVWGVAFSPDGKRVMSASSDGTLKLCNSYTGEVEYTFERHDALVNTAVFSPDGKYVASSGGENEVLVWDTRTGISLPPMSGHIDKVTALQFSPEGNRLVSASDDGSVRIWVLPEVEG
ncbi:WD40 repeat-like protein [Cubamyces sp. BRFM 1775]|nr:WD40 repeat-like protein [Cubamyces sp. BRFM 1775]